MENGTEAPEKLRPVMLFAGESGLRSPEKAVCVRRRRAALCLHPERTEVSAAEGKKTGPEGKANTHKDNNEIPLRAKEVLPGKVGGS